MRDRTKRSSLSALPARLLFLSLAAFLLLGACPRSVLSAAASAEEAASERKLTVMVYMCGSNLESHYGSATADLLEMEKAGISGNGISLLVMAGGSSFWTLGYNPDESVIIDVSAKGQRIIERSEKRNMGEKETLKAFLRYGAENRPAEQYALILWDHGGGPLEGVCWDEQFSGDRLTLQELSEALADSPFSTEKLAWIGFDACLMSTVEVAGRLAPYAEYMIASQAEEPAGGWNYSFLAGLEADSDGAETGRRVVDTYLETPQQGHPDLTMACVRLDGIAAVERAMDSMYRGIAAGLYGQTFSDLAKRRFRTTGFGRSAEQEQGMNGYDLADLMSLTRNYQEFNPDQAEEIQKTVNRAVVYARSNMEDCCGLSVYHPFRNRRKFTEAWNEAYARLCNSPGYVAYVNAYGRIMAGEHLIRWKHTSPTLLEGTEWNVALFLSGDHVRNLADARLVILAKDLYDAADDSYHRIYENQDVYMLRDLEDAVEGWQPDGALLMAAYGGESLQALDLTTALPATGALSYRMSGDGTLLLEMYPYGADGIRPEKPLIAEYNRDPETDQLTLKAYSVYDEQTGTYSRRAEVDLTQYKGITFLNEYRNPRENAFGEYPGFDAWPVDQHTDTHWAQRYDLTDVNFRLSFTPDQLRSEMLYAGFELIDTQGNVYMTDLIPLSGGASKNYAAEYCLRDDAPARSAYLLIRPDDSGFMMFLTNASEAAETYYLRNLEINGVSLMSDRWLPFFDPDGETTVISPGAEAGVNVPIPGDQMLAACPDHVIHHLSGSYIVRSDHAEQTLSLFSFTSEGEIPLDLEEGKEEATWHVQTKIPAAGDSAVNWGAYAVLNQSRFAEGSNVTLHLTMENRSEKSLFFALQVNSLNGIPVDNERYVWNADGSGGSFGQAQAAGQAAGISGNRFSLLQGEKRAASLMLNLEDLKALSPDPVLQECECILMIAERKDDGETEMLNLFPIRLVLQVPLAAFWQDAESLPEAIREELKSEEGKHLLSTEEGVSLSLLAVYGRADQTLLLLRGRNESEQPVSILLEHAEENGEPKVIGGKVGYLSLIRNNQVRAYGVKKELWPENLTAQLDLEAGASEYWYVTVRNERGAKEESAGKEAAAELFSEAGGKSGGSGLSDENSPVEKGSADGSRDQLCFDMLLAQEDTRLRWSRISLTGHWCGQDTGEDSFREANPEEIRIQAGELTPITGTERIFPVEVSRPERGMEKAAELQFRPEGDQTIRAAKYAIFRRMDSRAQMAERNFIRFDDYTEGQELLLLEMIGRMRVLEDGHAAAAEYSGLRLAVHSGEERFAIEACESMTGDDGTLLIESGVDELSLFHQDLPLGQWITNLIVSSDPNSGKCMLQKAEGADRTSPDWANYIVHVFHTLPGDAGEEQQLQFVSDLYGDERGNLPQIIQVLPVCPDGIRLAVEPIERPEECEVLFFWQDRDGGMHVSDPLPLTDVQQH